MVAATTGDTTVSGAGGGGLGKLGGSITLDGTTTGSEVACAKGLLATTGAAAGGAACWVNEDVTSGWPLPVLSAIT